MRRHYFAFPLVRAALFAGWTLVALTPAAVQADRAITLWIQHYASPALDAVLSSITIAGNAEITALLAVFIGLALLRSGRNHMAIALWAMFAAGSVFEWVSKHLLAHLAVPAFLHRPGLNILHYIIRTPYGYPSGHAFRTLLLVGAVWLAWGPSDGRARTLPRYAVIAGVALMGLALVYLGDHWASEVVGGYLLASLCLWPLGLSNSSGMHRRASSRDDH